MQKFTLTFLSLFVFAISLAQNQNKIAILEASVDPGEIIDELPLPPPKLEGDIYLDSEWKAGTIVLKNSQTIKDYPLRYDLFNNLIEIRYKDEIRVCALYLTDHIRFQDETILYLNSAKFKELNQLKNSVVQLLVEGPAKLVQYHYVEIKEPTYVPTVDLGNKNKKAVIKDKLYVLKENNAFILHSNIKKNQKLFGVHHSKLVQFAKQNKLKLRKSEDAQKLIIYFNSLL